MDLNQFHSTELSRDEFPLTWKALDSGLKEGVAPGFVVGFWSKDQAEQAKLGSLGLRRIIPTSQPMSSETIFDLASVTKVYATAMVAAVLVDQGVLTWSTPIDSILSKFRFPQIQIKHLLSHTAGYVPFRHYWEVIQNRFSPTPLIQIPIEERQSLMRELVFAEEPEKLPGERALYSDISFLLLGFALEELTQMSLPEAVKKWVWEPMGIQNSFYSFTNQPLNRYENENIAATENCPWRGGVIQGYVHDENCWAMGGYAGHAGVFGTARDLLLFARALLIGGFLSRTTLKSMWTRVAEPLGCTRTLGWDTPSGATPSTGTRFSPLSVGHLGFTGTSLWIDPASEIAVTLLTNRVHPTRENIKIRAFRQLLHEAVRLDLRR